MLTTNEVKTVQNQVRLNLGSQQVSKEETSTVNARNEPPPNDPKSHDSSLKLNSDHEDETFPET